jgi:hypothetical protein
VCIDVTVNNTVYKISSTVLLVQNAVQATALLLCANIRVEFHAAHYFHEANSNVSLPIRLVHVEARRNTPRGAAHSHHHLSCMLYLRLHTARHQYHGPCVTGWLEKKRTCPLCGVDPLAQHNVAQQYGIVAGPQLRAARSFAFLLRYTLALYVLAPPWGSIERRMIEMAFFMFMRHFDMDALL